MRKTIERFYLQLPMAEGPAFVFSWVTVVAFISITVFIIGFGMADANDKNKCKVESINDVLLSPVYALGCNLAKKRFDIKLN